MSDEKERDESVKQLEKPGTFAELRSQGTVTAEIGVIPRDPRKTPLDDIFQFHDWVRGVIAGLEREDDALEKAIRKYIESHNEWTRTVDKRLAKLEHLVSAISDRLYEIENPEEKENDDEQ